MRIKLLNTALCLLFTAAGLHAQETDYGADTADDTVCQDRLQQRGSAIQQSSILIPFSDAYRISSMACRWVASGRATCNSHPTDASSGSE